MSNVSNLNRFRKSKARSEKHRRAEENRARYGRSKAEKLTGKIREARAQKHLDGHKLEQEDE